MKKPFKVLLNILIIIIVLIIVLYYSLKDNYQEILTTIFTMNHLYFLLAIIVLCLYRFLTSVVYQQIIKLNKEQVSLVRCIQINFIILFFHGVTPFAGGGQPMEIYYLHKEKISISKSTNIVLQNFIVYQIALVTVGAISLIYNAIFHLFPADHLIKKLVIIGFVINLIVLLSSFIISFSKKTQKIILNQGINLLTKLKIIKEEEKVRNKFKEYLSNFQKNALQLKNNKSKVLNLIILNIISLCILYSMPYVLAQGMNIKLSLIESIVATSYVMIIGSFVPIPGGTGGIEYGFIFFYKYLIKTNIVNALMLVWRFVSYYLGIIFGAIALTIYRKRQEKCE